MQDTEMVPLASASPIYRCDASFASANWQRGGRTWVLQAVRAGHTVLFVRADDFFRAMAQARVDHSIDKTFRSFLAPDLLILDDLGLHRLTQQQSIDLYELVIARHRTSSFIVTSNRAVDEWLGLFDDPIL